MNMNYNTDKLINNQDQDLLGRSFFSSQLGKAIYEYNAKDGLVIGLFGKWGTEKTSIINMAINEINSLANCDKKEKSNENKPLIIKFSPWNYSDKDNLITLFFQSLKNKINYSVNTQQKRQELLPYFLKYQIFYLFEKYLVIPVFLLYIYRNSSYT